MSLSICLQLSLCSEALTLLAVSIPFLLLLLSTPLGSFSLSFPCNFVHWHHFPSRLPAGFCNAISSLMSSGFTPWPWWDLQTWMSFLLLENGHFSGLGVSALFLFWSPSLITVLFHAVGFFPAYSVPGLVFSFLLDVTSPSQSSLARIFPFLLSCYRVALKPWGTNCRSPTGFPLFKFLVAIFNNKFTFSTHVVLYS